MFSFVEPEASTDEHERLLAIEEELLQALEIPYRVVNIGADDLGASAAKKYDLEAWLPGQQRYREVTSTSNTTDFQSRRLDIRYRAEDGQPRHVHTLNGTAVTWRHLIALLENGQRDDGTVACRRCCSSGVRRGAAGRRRRMTSARRRSPPRTRTSRDEPPPPDDGEPEVDDQPLGPPADLDEDDAPLPGLPESEPPAGRLAHVIALRREPWFPKHRTGSGIMRTKGVSLAKGPVGIIGVVLLAGGILGLLMGSTDFTTAAPDGDVNGGTFLGIEGNGWTWLAFAGAGVLLLISATMHWSAKTIAMIVGLALGAGAVIAIVDGTDVLGVFAANRATMLVFGVAAVALLIVAMLPRVGPKRDEVVVDDRDATRNGRFEREERVEEPATTTTTTTDRRV